MQVERRARARRRWGGEQDWDLATWAQMIGNARGRHRAAGCDVHGRAIQDAAGRGHGRQGRFAVTPHSANLSLVTMCTMHLLGAISNAGKYLEFSIEGADYYPWQEGLFLGDPYAVEGGSVSIPSEPGWGVEINPAWLALAVYQCSETAG